MSHSYFIPKRRHAELIGKGGATVKGLQQQYNVRINIPSSQDPSCEVAVTGKGDLEAVRKEFERILGFAVSDKPLKAVGLNIKKDDHGALIGKGGATLKQIQANSGCVINIPKREDNSNIVSLEGTEAGIAKATAEIEHILGYKPATGAAQVYEAKEAKVPEMHIDHSKPLVDALFFPDLDGDNKEFNRFLGYLNSAQKTLDICVFTITDDRITNVILGAQKRGVKVRLITDNDTAIAEGSDIALFKKLGVLVKMDTTPFHMHHKFGIMDGKVLINGSFNWTRSASTTNQENVMVTNNAEFIKLFQGQFDLMWNDEKNFSSDAAPSGKTQH